MLRKTVFGLLLTQFLVLAYCELPMRTAEPSEYPFQVSIRDLIRDEFLCSGVLITKKTVLGPASCVPPGTHLKISAGSVHRKKQNRTMNCEEIIIHPKYNRSEMTNDIMLIILADPFRVDEYVAPAKIPTGSTPLAARPNLSGWSVLNPNDALKVYENYTVWHDCTSRYKLEKDLGPDEFCGNYTHNADHGSLISQEGVVYGLETDSSILKKMHSFVELSHHAGWIKQNLGKEALEVQWHGTNETNEAGSPSNCLTAMLIFVVFLCQ